MDNLFSTHPRTENRVAALQQLAVQMGQGGWAAPAAPGPWGAPRKRGPWG
jgi:heat shock protein HtpX